MPIPVVGGGGGGGGVGVNRRRASTVFCHPTIQQDRRFRSINCQERRFRRKKFISPHSTSFPGLFPFPFIKGKSPWHEVGPYEKRH